MSFDEARRAADAFLVQLLSDWCSELGWAPLRWVELHAQEVLSLTQDQVVPQGQP